MHRMTRDARGAEMRAPFDGTTLEVQGRRGRARAAGRRPLRPASSAARRRPATKTYRVTRVIGGRTREDFAGVEVGGQRRGGGAAGLVRLATRDAPLQGLLGDGARARRRCAPGPSGAGRCIFCHNTVPEIDRLLGAIAGPAAPGYQGEQVDRWLPGERRAHVARDRRRRPSRARPERGDRAARGRRAPARATARAIARRAMRRRAGRVRRSALVEVGIGCEACHGGRARARRAIRACARRSCRGAPWLDASPAEPRPGATAAGASRGGRHQPRLRALPPGPLLALPVHVGGRRGATRPPGGSHINSGEARDFLLGGCAGAMACTACHDPARRRRRARSSRALAHARGQRDLHRRATPSSPTASALQRARAPRPDGAGGSCIACHMPRKNMGLDGTLTRYHRIGSPTDAGARARRPPARVRALPRRPQRRRRSSTRWSGGGPCATRGSASRSSTARSTPTSCARRSSGASPTSRRSRWPRSAPPRDRSAAPLIARQLVGDYPLVREWAKRALTSILGRCDVDLAADDAAIARAAASCGGAAGRAGSGRRPRSRDGRGPGGLTWTRRADPRLVPGRPMAADAPRAHRAGRRSLSLGGLVVAVSFATREPREVRAAAAVVGLASRRRRRGLHAGRHVPHPARRRVPGDPDRRRRVPGVARRETLLAVERAGAGPLGRGARSSSCSSEGAASRSSCGAASRASRGRRWPRRSSRRGAARRWACSSGRVGRALRVKRARYRVAVRAGAC